MAVELFELLRFDYQNVVGKSVQLCQHKSQENGQLLVVSTQTKQIYVLSYNVLTHVVMLKNDVLCFINSDQQLLILTSLGKIFAVTLSNPASEVDDLNLDGDPVVIEVSDEHSIADFSVALAFLVFKKKVFVLYEAFGSYYLEVISGNLEIKQSRETQRRIRCLDAFQSHVKNGAVNATSTRTRLYILLPFSYKDYDSNDSTIGVLQICDQLYNCLFGRHSNLVNSPILLVVRPSGTVHWLQLCGFSLEFQAVNDTTSSSVNGVNVLCDLEQDVIGVFSIAAQDSKSTNAQSHNKSLPSQSLLLLISCQGTVLTIRCERPDGIFVPVFRRSLIPGPVICCDISVNFLFYSTGQDLLQVDLGELLVDSEKCGSVQQLKVKSLNLCNIVALSICVREISKPGEINMYVMTSSGRLSRLSLDLDNCSTKDLQTPGQTLSSQLVGIRQLSDEYRTLSEKSDLLDIALGQLAFGGLMQSQMHHLIQCHTEQTRGCQKISVTPNDASFPLCCSTSVQISQSKLHITVVLRNCSSFIFRCCWTFHVTVSKPPASVKSGMVWPRLSSSCRIDGLRNGESMSVTVELPCNFTSPFLVSPSLILDLEGLVHSSGNLAPLVLELPTELFTEMRLLRPWDRCRTVQLGSTQRDLSQILRAIAGHHSSTSTLQKDCLSSNVLQDYRFDICIPDQITREVNQLNPPVKADKDSDCRTLLEYLFASNSFFKGLPFVNKTIKAVSSYGHLVTINVQLSGPANSVVVSLQSCHIGLLAQLHLDITSRLKTLSCMRGTLSAANNKNRKSLLKEVEDLLLEFENDSTSDSSLTKVFSLYQSARSMR